MTRKPAESGPRNGNVTVTYEVHFQGESTSQIVVANRILQIGRVS